MMGAFRWVWFRLLSRWEGALGGAVAGYSIDL